jgi:hypothetical protein
LRLKYASEVGVSRKPPVPSRTPGKQWQQTA